MNPFTGLGIVVGLCAIADPEYRGPFIILAVMSAVCGVITEIIDRQRR